MIVDFLYYLTIYPIKLILECIFSVFYTSVFKGNIGIALGGLSLAVSLFCLPMYTIAEKLQQTERDIQKKLSNKIASIKRNFTGDERYFILSMFYRENNYHPLYGLRSSLSLFIQIPFFIAAYLFLSHLEILKGTSFLVFNDLSKPDGLLSFTKFNINILPLLMTVINLSTGIIYGNTLSAKEKIQLYVTPFIFLALLYNSPSALVIYWTLNNIFSFFKTIILKLKEPKKIIYLLGCLLTFLFVIYVLFIRYNAPDRAFRNKSIAVFLFLSFALLPVFLKYIRIFIKKAGITLQNEVIAVKIFIVSIISLWLLVSLFVPSNIIASDPALFASIKYIDKPLTPLYYTTMQGAGLLLFWPALIFLISSKNARTVLSLLVAALSLHFFANFFLFKADYGVISEFLEFNLKSGEYLYKSKSFMIVNTLFLFIILTGILFLAKIKKIHFIYSFLIVISLGTFAFSISKIVTINHTPLPVSYITAITDNQLVNQNFTDNDTILMSKNGKNVVIFMLDTAIGSYFPLFINEKPEMIDRFNGFTYYQNTISLFRSTMFGAPPLFGGYEYSSENMDKRDDKTVKEKQQEAYTLLPLLFKNLGFSSNVIDVPVDDFFDTPINEYYAAYGITAKNMESRFNKKYMNEVLNVNELVSNARIDELIKRNLIMLSFVDTFPYALRDFLYINGNYWSTNDFQLDSAISLGTIGGYTTLYYLPELTKIEDGTDTFYIITSNLTHNPVFLQYPDFTLEIETTNRGHNFFHSKNAFQFFHANAAAYMLLSKWFEYLKENEVWDNTRIIIVSDHGRWSIDHPEFNSFQNTYVLNYNPILLVKDFDSNGSLITNNDFMTNADTSLLALQGITETPVNPFTEKTLTAEKENGIYIYTQGFFNANMYPGTRILNDNSLFFHVHTDIFDRNNWTELKYKDFKEN
jgi:YidC/Oxa1 family membrane protein insertase